MDKKHIQHLYWRAGFGIDPITLNSLKGKSRFDIVDDLFYASRRATPLRIDKSSIKEADPRNAMLDKSAKEKFRLLLVKKTREFNILWIERLQNPKELLRERMTLFWANHFVCQTNNAVYAERYNNTLRTLALGSFRGFVKAISREAAMIDYLNLKQNRKRSPNENFARELMELFTLGREHYTEADIKQSARAFTGYNHDFNGNFEFRKWQHDFGRKRFFDRRGQFNGDDIIDIIVLEKQCARFICNKVYKYFVNDTINTDHVEQMVAEFYPAYDIEKLMRFVFMSDWFYDDINIGTKIKSPVDFMIGMGNMVPMKFKKEKQIIGIQSLLGQILLFPPNVAGWKTGQNWIDSNTMILRLRLPSLLLSNGVIQYRDSGQFSDPLYNKIMRELGRNLFQVISNWEEFNRIYTSVELEHLPQYILQCKLSNHTKALLNKLQRRSKKDYVMQLMSLPEYQMC